MHIAPIEGRKSKISSRAHTNSTCFLGKGKPHSSETSNRKKRRERREKETKRGTGKLHDSKAGGEKTWPEGVGMGGFENPVPAIRRGDIVVSLKLREEEQYCNF